MMDHAGSTVAAHSSHNRAQNRRLSPVGGLHSSQLHGGIQEFRDGHQRSDPTIAQVRHADGPRIGVAQASPVEGRELRAMMDHAGLSVAAARMGSNLHRRRRMDR
jgi:hypothetical protein